MKNLEEMTDKERAAAERALVRLKVAQSKFWDAIRNLESLLDIDIDNSESDFEGYMLEDFLDEEDHENVF